MKLPSPALSFRSPRPVRKFVENLIIKIMIDISSITNMISALRAQTSPNSITPEGLGSILQRIANLIGSLSQVPEQEATDLVARMTQCESNSQTALQAARSAQATADGNVIDVVGYEQTATGVTVTVEQHSGNSNSATIPSATTTLAGVMSAEDKDHLDKVYQRTMASLTTSSTETQVKLNYKRHNNQITTVTLVGASSSAAGLMTAADKVKLDGLGSEFETLQEVQQQVLALAGEFAPLNGTKNRIIPIYEGFMMLDSMGESLDTVDGATYSFASARGKCWYDPINKRIVYWWEGAAGASRYEPTRFPSVFFNKVTGRCYLWNNTTQEMEEWITRLM